MEDIRGYQAPVEVETTSNRSKLLGGAIVAVGAIALGAFAYASGALNPQVPAGAPGQQFASNAVPATPGMPQSQTPAAPPVTPTPLDQTPLAPQPSTPRASSNGQDQQASAEPKRHVARTKHSDDEAPASSDGSTDARQANNAANGTASMNTPAPAAAPPENAAPQQPADQTPPIMPQPVQPSQPESAQPPQ